MCTFLLSWLETNDSYDYDDHKEDDEGNDGGDNVDDEDDNDDNDCDGGRALRRYTFLSVTEACGLATITLPTG